MYVKSMSICVCVCVSEIHKRGRVCVFIVSKHKDPPELCRGGKMQNPGAAGSSVCMFTASAETHMHTYLQITLHVPLQ